MQEFIYRAWQARQAAVCIEFAVRVNKIVVCIYVGCRSSVLDINRAPPHKSPCSSLLVHKATPLPAVEATQTLNA
ncbi:hypothetical protein PM082_018667 [Marasmius tenuissimus]|nr:hypothetical protein PM082_018667 [Marasmius tenuissimus]